MSSESKSQPIIIVAKTADEVEKLRPFWTKINDQADCDIDFFTMLISMQKDVLHPYVLTVTCNGEPKAILIGRLETCRVPLTLAYFTLAKINLSQLVILRGGFQGDCTLENANLLFRHITTELQQGLADRVFFEGLDPSSDLAILCSTTPPRLCRGSVGVDIEHWQVTLPSTWEEFLKQKSAKHRSELRRLNRYYDEQRNGRVQHCVYDKKEQVNAFCVAAEEVASKTYQRGLGVGFMNSAFDHALVTIAAERGWLKAYTISLDNTPLAFWAGRLYKGTMYADWTGFDPNYQKLEPGTVTFCKMIEDLCKSGAHSFDFGPGSALYKKRLGNKMFIERVSCIYPPTIKGVIVNLLISSFLTSNGWAKSIALKLKIADRIKSFWRKRLTALNSGSSASIEKPSINQ